VSSIDDIQRAVAGRPMEIKFRRTYDYGAGPVDHIRCERAAFAAGWLRLDYGDQVGQEVVFVPPDLVEWARLI
jgi:hypothetical protein